MSKKEALTQFHKDSIADAADILFQQNGIEKTTMDDVPRLAEYSKRTVYVYFKSKDEIYHYIIHKAMKMLHERIVAGISSNVHPVKQYQGVCFELSAFAEENPFYYQSLTETIAADPTSRGENQTLESIYQVGEQINQTIEDMLNNGIEQGVFRDDAGGAQVGIFCWAALSGVILLANNKEQYIQQRLGLNKKAFLEYSFNNLLKSIVKEDGGLNE